MTTPDCGGCPLHDDGARSPERREFLRVAGLALASLSMLGLGADRAAALPIRVMHVLGARRGDRAAEKRYPIPAADVVSIDRDNSVIIVRSENRVYAFALSCPHQNTALRWDAEDRQFHCPKHKSRYQVDGTFIEGRSTRDMDRLAVRRDGGELVVDVDTLYQEDLNTAQWKAAFIAV
ncbi:MAG: Rieske (2Fe-2S) protein [Gemmatimonadota bacterium]|nr:Rieske (2Fe-2S) protein [Gemmatimonadota bacterium]